LHWRRFYVGNFLDLLKIVYRTLPVSDATAKSGAGEETSYDVSDLAKAAKALHCLVKHDVGSACIFPPGGRPQLGYANKGEPKAGATKRQTVQSLVAMPLAILMVCSARSITAAYSPLASKKSQYW
jgi:hypothetical protein